MKNKPVWVIPLVIAVVIGLAMLIAASVFFFNLILNSHIEDTNGSDTSLCSLTDEKLFGSFNSHISMGSISTDFGNTHTYSVNKLSGVYNAVEFRASGDMLVIHVDATLSAGNLRMVLLCDGEYVQDIPLGEDQTITIPNPDGKYQIRLGAESAKLRLECTYEVE